MSEGEGRGQGATGSAIVADHAAHPNGCRVPRAPRISARRACEKAAIASARARARTQARASSGATLAA